MCVCVCDVGTNIKYFAYERGASAVNVLAFRALTAEMYGCVCVCQICLPFFFWLMTPSIHINIYVCIYIYVSVCRWLYTFVPGAALYSMGSGGMDATAFSAVCGNKNNTRIIIQHIPAPQKKNQSITFSSCASDWPSAFPICCRRRRRRWRCRSPPWRCCCSPACDRWSRAQPQRRPLRHRRAALTTWRRSLSVLSSPRRWRSPCRTWTCRRAIHGRMRGPNLPRSRFI